MARVKKDFYMKIKRKIHFLGVIINLFLVIRCNRKKIYLFECSYIASDKNGV